MLFGFGTDPDDEEGRVTTAEFDKFYLVICYVPNSGAELARHRHRINKWDVMFRDHVNELAEKKDVILMGDFNVAHKELDIYNPKGKDTTAGFTNEERENFGKILEGGFTDTFRHFYPKIRKYTWWSQKYNLRSENRGWRIDYCLVNNNGLKNVIDSGVNDAVFGSDHCPVELLYKIGDATEEKQPSI